MGRLREIEGSLTTENDCVDREWVFSIIKDSGLCLELAFSYEQDRVSDLEKPSAEVFSNTKLPELDPEETLSDTNIHGYRESPGFPGVLHGCDKPKSISRTSSKLRRLACWHGILV